MMTPLVRESLATVLASRFGSDIQLIPVEVHGSKERYLILNVTTRGDFLDKLRSGITYRNPQDKDTPQERYWSVGPLVIDDRKAQGHHLFRIRGWEPPLILSEVVKSVLEDMGVKGIGFLPASL